MDSFHSCPVTPNTDSFYNGLQACADWDAPPALPQPYQSSSSPPAYSPSCYDGRYISHDLKECVHARLLCQERFAELRTLVADLDDQWKRSQCRCGQSAWSRTKSFVKRALTLRFRRKSQRSSQKPPGWEHPESRVSSWLAGDVSLSKLGELPPDHVRRHELDARQNSFRTYYSLPATYIGGPNHQHAGCDVMPNPHTVLRLTHDHGPHFKHPFHQHMDHLGQLPVPGFSGTMLYSKPSSPASPWGSASCHHLVGTPSSQFLVSPQSSSYSSGSSSVSPATPAGYVGSHLAAHVLAYPSPPGSVSAHGYGVSPRLCHQAEFEVADLTAPVELPDTSPLPELGDTQWSQQHGHRGYVPLLVTPTPPQRRPRNEEPSRLHNSFVVRPAPTRSLFYPLPPKTENLQATPASNAARPDSPAVDPVLRAKPQPQIPDMRLESSASTTNTVLDFPMSGATLDATPDGKRVERPPSPPHNTESAVGELPSQQRSPSSNGGGESAPTRQARARRHTASPTPDCCDDCRYYPAKGPDQRKKMRRHLLTDKHRRNTGQQQLLLLPQGGEGEGKGAGADAVVDAGPVKYPCGLCGATYNRRDNLRDHVKKQHGVAEQGGGGPGAGRQVWRVLTPRQNAAGGMEGGRI